MHDDILQYWEKILNAIADGVVITDRLGVIRMVNVQYERLTGFAASDVVGRNASDLIREGLVDMVLYPEIVASGKSITRVQRYANNNRLILTGVPVSGESGEVVLVVTFIRDITQLSRMRDELDAQRKLVERYEEQWRALSGGVMGGGMGGAYAGPASAAMRRAYDDAARWAKTDLDLLILGETGVGKDVLARFIHAESSRCDHIFFKVDCAALTDSLATAEFFGYAPGAFTGASAKGRAGYFETASGGTIFLDEVGELTPPIQAKLLRVLQDREILRIGSSTPRKVDVRIISATHRNLGEMVRKKLFREDLYYRLNAVSLTIPPLRERGEDITPLAEHFLHLYNRKYAHSVRFSPSLLQAFARYAWPGNVRELEHIVHSLVSTQESGKVGAAELPVHMAAGKNVPLSAAERYLRAPEKLSTIMAGIEREFLLRAIAEYGSVRKAAKAFQVDRSTVFRKIRGSRSDPEE